MMRRRTGGVGRGFTLIELLIVVALMAVLTAVVVPLMLGAARVSSKSPTRELAQATLQAAGVGGEALSLESSEVRVRLGASPVLDGVQVHTRYMADFQGEFRVRPEQPGGPVRLEFPFPPGVSEARGAQLDVRDARGLPAPGAARYSQQGMSWEGSAAGPLLATVTYQAEGRDAFVYGAAGAGRSGAIRFTLETAPGTPLTLEPGSLAPTAVSSDRMEFVYDHLITRKPIAVRLPPGPSPLGRVILLCQLAGAAVLLFGAGFWYLSEQRAPGALDDFRWGHFLLLALNHGLFFALFAVLGYDGQVVGPLVLAAAPSLTLLTLHVARTFDLRFAVGRALPLAALTLGAAVAGVYLEPHRPLLLVALLALLLGYVTLTYRDWSARRLAHEQRAQRRRERQAHLTALRQRWSKVQSALDESRATSRDAGELLALSHGSPASSRLAERRAQLDAEIARSSALESDLQRLEEIEDEREGARELELVLRLALPRLERERGVLSAVREELHASLERDTLRAREVTRSHHCTACGERMADGAQFCAACGEKAPERFPCQGCGHEALLPGQWRALARGALRCHGCGAPVSADHPPTPAPA